MPRTIPDHAVDLSVTTTRPSYDEANLLMSILNGPIGEKAHSGSALLMAYPDPPSYEQFLADHPVGTDSYERISCVLTLGETVGTFVKQGLLSRGLVDDMLWTAGAWRHGQHIALGMRAEAGEPAIYENFEALATG